MKIYVRYFTILYFLQFKTIFTYIPNELSDMKFSKSRKYDISKVNADSIYRNFTTRSTLRCASKCSVDQICRSFDSCSYSGSILCRLRISNLDETSAPELNSTTCYNYKKDDFVEEHILHSTTTIASTTEIKPCQNNGIYNSGAGTCTCQTGCYGSNCATCYSDCQDGASAGLTGVTVGYIHPPGVSEAVQTLCHYSIGITYIQYRKYGNVNFNRSWDEYKNGFGDPNGDFWLGNKYIHALANYKSYRMTFKTFYSGSWKFFSYGSFQLQDESQKYSINYDSSAYSLSIDGLSPTDVSKKAQGQSFKTYDSDTTGCAVGSGSGWWFNSGCSASNVNGPLPITWGSVSTVSQTGIGLR